MVMVKATKESEAGVLPDEKMLAAMGKYNEELVKAGVIQDGAGRAPVLWASGCAFRPASRL
jgi:hypothetical protein